MSGSTSQVNKIKNAEFEPIEPIEYGFRYGKLGDLRVILDKNGLINLTELCSLLHNKNKCYAKWEGYPSSQKTITNYRVWFTKNISDDESLFMYRIEIAAYKGIAPLRCVGTYGIREIALEAARWLSFDFMVATNKIILDFFDRERLAEIRQLKGEKNDLLAKMDNMEKAQKETQVILVEIRQQNNRLEHQNDELITQNKRLEQYAVEEIKKHNETHITLEEVRADCREALQVVHKTAPRTVGPEIVPEREEYIRVWKLTGQVLAKYPFDYVCCRVQYKNLKAAFRRLKSRHGELQEIDTIGPIPNSVHDYSCFSQYEGVTMRSVYMNVDGGDAVLRAIIAEVKESELMYATTP